MFHFAIQLACPILLLVLQGAASSEAHDEEATPLGEASELGLKRTAAQNEFKLVLTCCKNRGWYNKVVAEAHNVRDIPLQRGRGWLRKVVATP